ncbi:MAG: hypothetical protein EBT55_06285, partial [Proteobacteria bacterium]|nr:hypothetical protein [Pseudomonadota bacterium]
MPTFAPLLTLFVLTSKINEHKAQEIHIENREVLAKATSGSSLFAEIQKIIEESGNTTWDQLFQKFSGDNSSPSGLKIQLLQPEALQNQNFLSKPVSDKSFFDLLRNLWPRRLDVAGDIHSCTDGQLCDQILHGAILNGLCAKSCIENIGGWLAT